MTLRSAIHYALPNSNIRYIQRMVGNTIFDIRSYNPSLLGEDDIVADDWIIPHQGKISYSQGHIRFGMGFQE